MAFPERAAPQQSRFKDDARNFWHRVSEGLALNQLWSQFEKDARSSYRLYSAGLDAAPAEPSRIRRGLQMAKTLFWAILEKLSPVRRLPLLVAVIPVGFSCCRLSY